MTMMTMKALTFALLVGCVFAADQAAPEPGTIWYFPTMDSIPLPELVPECQIMIEGINGTSTAPQAEAFFKNGTSVSVPLDVKILQTTPEIKWIFYEDYLSPETWILVDHYVLNYQVCKVCTGKDDVMLKVVKNQVVEASAVSDTIPVDWPAEPPAPAPAPVSGAPSPMGGLLVTMAMMTTMLVLDMA